MLVNQILDHRSTVHIQDDKSLERGSKLCSQFTSHHLYDFLNLAVDDITIGLHFAFTHVIKDLFDTLGPVNLIDSKNNLAGPLCNPLSSLIIVVVLDRVERQKLERLSHDSFNFEHPLLDIALLVAFIDINLSAQFNVFLLC